MARKREQEAVSFADTLRDAKTRMRMRWRRTMADPTAPHIVWPPGTIVVGTIPGIKHDEAKPRLSLLFVLGSALDSVVKNLEYGEKKYPSVDNWQKVENAEKRYIDATLRHLRAHCAGEDRDPESGLPHLHHAACSVLMSVW